MLGHAEPDNTIHAAEYDFAKWRGIPRETTRAVLEDCARNPEKCGELLKKHEGGRIRFPEGGPHKHGDLTAAMDRLNRATGAARRGGP